MVLESMVQNVRIFAKHVGTKDNGKADALSRLDLVRFRKLGGVHMNEYTSLIPRELWPMTNVW